MLPSNEGAYMSDLEAVLSQLQEQASGVDGGVALGADYESATEASDADLSADEAAGQAETAEQDQPTPSEQAAIDYEKAFKGLQGSHQQVIERERQTRAELDQMRTHLAQVAQQQAQQLTPVEQQSASRIQQAEWLLEMQRPNLTPVEVQNHQTAIANAKNELTFKVQQRLSQQAVFQQEQMSVQQRAQLNEMAKPLYMQRLIEQAKEVGATLTPDDLAEWADPENMLRYAKREVAKQLSSGTRRQDQQRVQASQDRQTNGRFASVRQGQTRPELEKLRGQWKERGLNSQDDIAAALSASRQVERQARR